MKLICTLSKNTMAGTLFMLMATLGFARNHSTMDTRRVFWNKFDVQIGKDNSIILSWNVTEYNNKSFVVQHSQDGVKWEDIAMVQSRNSPESMTNYSYTYYTKSTGIQYFRLKDIDVDFGTTGYSPVKTLMLRNERQVTSIWPNPVTTHLLISNDDAIKYTVARFIDLAGHVLIERKLEPNITDIPVDELTPGIYIVRIDNGKGAFYTQKIVKQ